MRRPLTNCSDSGTFWSFILWTPAEAEPSSAAAARQREFFILVEALQPICDE
jgi:hypothetical protein